MKVLSVSQLQRKKFQYLGFKGEWQAHLGNMPMAFVGLVYGKSGGGKTEYCMRLAKYLCNFGRVAWLSYEQGHDNDFVEAVNRNKMEEVSGKFLGIDPLANADETKTRYEQLDEFLSRKSCPEFIFIDSLPYLEMKLLDYFNFKAKHGKKRGIIFITHEKSGEPDSTIGQKIGYDGKFTIFVKNLVARHKKVRNSGWTNPYHILWEEEARRRDPLFFKHLEEESDGGEKKEQPKKKTKSKKEQE